MALGTKSSFPHQRTKSTLGGDAKFPNGERPRMVAHLLENFSLDLTDTFTRDAEFLPDLLKSMPNAIFESKAHLDDLALTRREKLEHGVHILLLELPIGGIEGINGILIPNKVPELAILLRSHRSLERDDVLTDLLDMTDTLDIHIHFDREFLYRGFTPE